MKWFEDDTERFWKLLILFALFVNLIAVIGSENGLDTHVKDAYVEVDDGYALDWGDTRLDDPLASNPEDSTIVANNPTVLSSNYILSLCFIVFLGFMATMLGKGFGAIILLHPTLIYSVGKGYDEPLIASLMGIMAFLLLDSVKNNSWPRKAMVGLPLLLILFVKTTSPADSMLIPVLLFIIVMASSTKIPDRFFNPRKMLGIGFACGGGLILLLGLLGQGTPSIIVDEPGRFLYALPFAFIDVVLIYGFFGMVLWPFAKSTWEKMGTSEDRLASELSLLIGGLAGLITMYVAVLWAYESILWNSDWPWHMVTMGNNGRYITILAIPVFMLIKRINGDIDWADKKVFAGVILILPLSLLAGIHGQTMWTDEAAESMEIEEGGHFLFVSDATLGMHWLYTFHSPLDAEENNITGHWRSDEANWIVHLEGDLHHIDWIVLSPDITETPEGWTLVNSGKADYLNGGGEWRVLTRA